MDNETRFYRALSSEVRFNVDADGKRHMTGYFSVTNTPYEIHSMREGRFLETIASGAFTETLLHDRSDIKVLLEHGHDPTVADKPLGRIVELSEDERGARYDVELLDTSYVRDLIPALEAGIYSASFRFSVADNGETWNEQPERSERNPNGIPERTITRLNVMEFGPVLWPANPAATASVRSLNDKFDAPILERAKHTESRRVEVEPAQEDVTSPRSGVPTSEASEVRDSKNTSNKEGSRMFRTVEERRARLGQIAERLKVMTDEHQEASLPEAEQAEYEQLRSEAEGLEQANHEVEERRALVSRLADAGRVESVRSGPAVHTKTAIYDPAEIRKNASGVESERRLMLENSERIIERADYSASNDDAAAKAQVVNVLRYSDKQGALARRVALTASPEYRRAFGKWVASEYLEPEEQRAMALGTDVDGGFGVPHELDPTIILTSGGAINPLRDIARVERIVGKTLQLVTSAGVKVTRHTGTGEGVPTVDGTPKFAREEFNTGRVSAYLEETIEIEAAYSGLDAQLTRALMEAKEEEEALTFVTAAGDGLTNGVQGLNTLNGLGSLIDVAAKGTLTYSDVFALDNALKPRHRRNAVWLANNTTYNKIRLIDENSGGDLWSGRQGGRPATLNEHDAIELSELFSQGGSTTAPFLLYGDFQKYCIVDRIGMVMDRVPVAIDPVTGTPNGKRGLAAFWWNGGGFIDPAAFKGLKDDGA